ncbi:hypothetical protein PAMP_016406 [Pampus punctatissimus]
MAGSCVRVDPPFVEFNDVTVGQVYKLFKFTVTSPAMEVLAPGLSVSGMLVFTPQGEEEEVKDCLLIHIDASETIKIPLCSSRLPRTCSLLIDSKLDFGCVAANSQVISRYHPITNQGLAPGVFQVQYSGDPSVRFSPCNGVIAAGTTKWLKIELRTDRPRQIDEKALVNLQNRSTVVLSIRAEVVDQRLEVFDLQGTPLSCLWFGPVYFGTSHLESVVLKNNAPQACNWVCTLQDTAAGTEVGTNLQKSTDAVLLERRERCSSATQDVSKVLVCVPKQGRLGPYDKTTVVVRFSPICKSEGKKRDCSSSRQNYCLFLLFESVESKHGFTHRYGNNSVELAVTGTGLPVSLVPSPSQRFNFLTCVTGQRVDLLCVLQNFCPQLPVNFHFRKLAHFTTEPSKGTIAPGQCQDVVLSFIARQQGSFQVRQVLDVLGYVVCQRDDNHTEDVTGLELRSFHTITLHLSAVCHSITPAVTNPTGLRPHIRSSELALCRGMARAAVLSTDKTQLHIHRRERSRNPEGEEFLAFPNDRATSIRPASPHRQYRTIFTGVCRYRYVDSNYALTEEEEEQRWRHRQIYIDFIKQLRQTRLQRIMERQQENVEDDVNIGIVPSQGLVPPELRITEMEISKISESRPKYSNDSPATKFSHPQELTPITRQVSEVMNAVPSTSQEVADCNRTLTAQELNKIVIGPLLVDFGEVCVQSVCVQKLELINHLSVFVWLQLEVDWPELQGSSPLSHVLPPRSHNTLPLTFQGNKLGHFYRPVSYSVNQQHPGQILVQAQVVPVALELSTTLLVLRPTSSLLAASGYRSSVTLRNQRNHPAEFTWQPVVTESGILFSIRPATGTVEPYRELDCEVVWHPSFSSPSEGDFDLCVLEGNTQRLHCIAKVGFTSVQLAEKQVIFGSVPLNMPSVRTAVLHNTGQNHAYYQVLDVCPLPGMVVSPSEGVVPSGGQAVVKIHFNPNSVIKFDTRVEIALRNMKSIELRVGGSVEPPNVDLSVSHFQFYEVHVGSRRAIPFSLTNCSSATARVTLDLSEYTDFSLQLLQPSAKKEPGVSVVEVLGYQTVGCSLVFSPIQAASYDFHLPLMINGARWPSACPPPFPTPPSSSASSTMSAGSRKHIVKSLPHSVTMATQPSLHIQATVLCAPLEMSPSSLQFHVEPFPQSDTNVSTKTVKLKAVCEESVCWRGFLGESVYWWFDPSATTVSKRDKHEAELCMVSPSSGSLGPGQSICLAVSIRPEAITTVDRVTKLSLPLYLRDEGQEGQEGLQPYRELSITITLLLPNITIHPPQILLSPAPLESNATASLTLLVLGYPRGTEVSAEVDEVELEDGTKLQPISVIFPEGNTILPHEQRHVIGTQNQGAVVTSLMCSVSFCSPVPLSLCTTITFTDHLHNRFRFELCAVADNCLLTVWPYLALHRYEQQIVLKTGATAFEAALQRYHTPSSTSGQTSSSSSTFDRNSSTNKNSTSDSFPDSESVSGQASRDEDASPNRDATTNLGVPDFPTANSEEGLYHQNVLLAVERWFSLFGWPSGPHPISVPHTLRRSVVDMLHHLTGKQIPRIPHCQTFSSDIDRRTNQLLQQHEAMLAFLRVQGACLCHIRPEYLLDVQEFNHWCSLRANKEEHGRDYSTVNYESLSKRSWTDVLLQIYKVLVLCSVSESSLNTTLSQEDGILPVDSQPLASNIYSPQELQLLSWLNMHYQSMRKTVWGTGGVPSARWIVNFDLDLTDGLVLAALLAAYCPYLICSHFRRMYTTTTSLEQILHNNIIVTQALNTLSLNIDLQVRLKSPSSKPVKYQALLLGEDAHFFSLPDGSTVTIPPKASTELSIQYSCSFLQPMEAVILLISSSASGMHATTLAFSLKTQVSHITPTNTVKCKSPCYETKVIQVPITNPFIKEAKFSIENMTPDKSCGEEMEGKCLDPNTYLCMFAHGEDSEFLSAVRTVCVKSGQADTLKIHYLPFCPGRKYCLVLLVCPQVGDMVYLVKATAELPPPSPLTYRPSSNIDPILNNSDSTRCVSVLRLRCKVGQVCEEVMRVPLINMAWEQALAVCGQRIMSTDEHRRRMLTHTLHSSTVRATAAARKLFKQQAQLRGVDHSKGVEYSVEVSLPEYFTLPNTVAIPIEEDTDIPWENSAGCLSFVEIDGVQEADKNKGNVRGCYEVYFSLEIICEQAAAIKVIHVECAAQSSVAIEIPVNNPQGEPLMLDVYLEGDGLSGADWVSVPPQETLTYKVMFSPDGVGKTTGRWTRQIIPLVNPTAETLELIVANSNPRNFTLEEDTGSTLQEWCVLLSGRGLNPESEEPVSISSAVGSNASITIPVTNPTELPAMLNVTLTDENPSGAPDCHPVATDKEVFTIPLSHTEGIQMSEGDSVDVPVVFAPNSMELQQAWLCIVLKPLSSLGNNKPFITDNVRSEQELSTICWIYPLRGIPIEVPVENSLGTVQCEVGCQLEKKVDVLLTGCVPGNQAREGQEVSQMTMEEFLCEVRSDKEAEGCLSASIETGRRNPETGIVTLTMNLVYAPLRPCRCSAVLAVQCVSGQIWEFPVTLIAMEPLVDDTIVTETTELGKTSAVGFRLTSTTRRPEPFTAAFLPGSSSEFTVTPASGMLPPAGSSGALITVSFTPHINSKRHRARLTIQAADMQWMYDVRGKTCHDSPPVCTTSTSSSSSVLGPANERQRNFVTHDLQLPALANCR